MSSNHKNTIRIAEIFGPTIQGEGALIGKPTVFVRTGGCDYRCTWCDSMHAVDSIHRDTWTPMTPHSIMEEIERLTEGNPILVTLSGGNPAIQNMETLIDLGQDKGYTFAIETQGSISQDWFEKLDHCTLSPKPPSSGMDFNIEHLRECIKLCGKTTDIILKFVVNNDDDFAFSQHISEQFPYIKPYIQPCNNDLSDAINTQSLINDYKTLVKKTMTEKWYNATVLPQLHVWLWGNKQGV